MTIVIIKLGAEYMKIKELIKELEKHDEKLEVFFPNGNNFCGNINHIWSVKKDTWRCENG